MTFADRATAGGSPRRRAGWPSAAASMLAGLPTIPAGWGIVVAVSIPADRGEESASVLLGVGCAIVWMSLIAVSAWLAYWRRGKTGNAIFLPVLGANLVAVCIPWVAGAVIAALHAG